MSAFFARNITTSGRVVRAAAGLAAIIVGLLLSKEGTIYCTVLVITGGFLLYEAARGWCLARACGIKTRL